ncbi:uncharacterized protein LOC132857897 [Tachysurus vachellii]|uniref:uncharacterized protein LOC132857897 n=1 Tax=Tachysurus vachellii TaxID=175792 RepID=UPI00296ABE6F|nr:uncharacterized protein LOC132857897 [Tachysurus vachellii]
MLYGLETVTLKKRQESELEVAELKMLRFSLGVTRLDRIRNKYIRGTAHVGSLGDKVREARLRWFGHVQRRESEYIGRRMLDMELPGRRQRGRPKRRYMDVINEDMKLVGASVEDAEDRDRWREMICCGDPEGKSRKRKKMKKKKGYGFQRSLIQYYTVHLALYNQIIRLKTPDIMNKTQQGMRSPSSHGQIWLMLNASPPSGTKQLSPIPSSGGLYGIDSIQAQIRA